LGDGPEKSAIKSRIKQLGLEKVVVMPGFVRQDEMASYFYDSSLFVLTSQTEAFGLVLAEAMSYGVPCVAFDSASGARAQITPEVGVLIKNRDQGEMAKKIVGLLRDEAGLKKYQKQIDKQMHGLSKSVIFTAWQKIL